MTVLHLVIQEIRHRKLSFALSVLAVLVAVGCLVAAVTLLRAHDIRTDRILADKTADVAAKVRARQVEADKRAAELNEAYRKIMLKFGYNLLIVPKQERLIDYRLRGAPSTYMPEQNVHVLADSGIMTVRHLLPILQERRILVFGDRRQEVFLIGTRGEVPLGHRAAKEPLLVAVPPDGIVVGHDVHYELGVKVGDKVKVVDREFTVAEVYGPRGTNDDSSVWIDLKQAQGLLGREGKINGILAMNCLCDRRGLDKTKKDIQRILPDVQIRVMVSSAVIRYESRVRAAQEAEAHVAAARRQGQADIESERRSRQRVKGQIVALVGWLVPLVLVGGAMWLALLAFGNVRVRRREIGVLRALGLRSRQIVAVFLARSALTGAVGACAGYAAGFLLAAARPAAPPIGAIFDPLLLCIVLPAAPALSALAGSVPAMAAGRQDPAVVLREA